MLCTSKFQRSFDEATLQQGYRKIRYVDPAAIWLRQELWTQIKATLILGLSLPCKLSTINQIPPFTNNKLSFQLTISIAMQLPSSNYYQPYKHKTKFQIPNGNQA